ncbi:MAG: nucleoside deaminase [Gemmatimonadota bacterium]|nr:MAG: nucleoside deaminase [Gemmatimonadota bacterium]
MSDERHIAFLRHAIKIATENVESGEGGPFGAVVVRDDRVIATGVNRVTAMNDPTAHAEMMAVREACRTLGDFQLTGCEIYCSSEPCPMCMGAIYWARAERIFYAATRVDAATVGFDDQFIYDELAMDIAGRSIPAQRLLADEALIPFEHWTAQPGRVNY